MIRVKKIHGLIVMVAASVTACSALNPPQPETPGASGRVPVNQQQQVADYQSHSSQQQSQQQQTLRMEREIESLKLQLSQLRSYVDLIADTINMAQGTIDASTVESQLSRTSAPGQIRQPGSTAVRSASLRVDDLNTAPRRVTTSASVAQPVRLRADLSITPPVREAEPVQQQTETVASNTAPVIQYQQHAPDTGRGNRQSLMVSQSFDHVISKDSPAAGLKQQAKSELSQTLSRLSAIHGSDQIQVAALQSNAPLLSLESMTVYDDFVVFRLNYHKNDADFSVSDDFSSLVLKAAREAKHVDIQGRTDAEVDSRANQKVASARAENAFKFLLDHGIDSSKISMSSLGSGDFYMGNETEYGKARNRRVEITAIGLDTSAYKSNRL